MAPSKNLPAALHLELSEYASLLRTIRTNSTLDIVPKLSRPPSIPQSLEDGEGQDNEDFGSDEQSQRADNLQGPQNPKQPSKEQNDAKNGPRTGKRKKATVYDSWTRWPLLLEDCPVPEWGFDEEVQTIAEHSLRSYISSPVTSTSGSIEVNAEGFSKGKEEHDDDDQFDLSSVHLSGLTSDASSKLSNLLSLLALHRPNVTYTKHGRVDPMKWEDILEIAGIVELFDKEVIKDVKHRMEESFGPSGTEVIRHMEVIETSRRTLATAEAMSGQDLLSLVGPPAPKRRQTKRKRDVDNSLSEVDVEVKTAEKT